MERSTPDREAALVCFIGRLGMRGDISEIAGQRE
jgi:hypothetical protein